jgi:hypothetical protein
MKTLNIELPDGTYYLRRPVMADHLDFLGACQQYLNGMRSERLSNYLLDKLRWVGLPPDRSTAIVHLDEILTQDLVDFIQEVPELRELPDRGNGPAASCGDDWIDLVSLFDEVEDAREACNYLSRWDLTAWLWRRNVLAMDREARKQFYYGDIEKRHAGISEEQLEANRKFAEENTLAYGGDLASRVAKFRAEKLQSERHS